MIRVKTTPNFVALTTATNSVKCYINVQTINSFIREQEETLLFCNNGTTHFHVQETPEQILELLEAEVSEICDCDDDDDCDDCKRFAQEIQRRGECDKSYEIGYTRGFENGKQFIIDSFNSWNATVKND